MNCLDLGELCPHKTQEAERVSHQPKIRHIFYELI